DVALGELADMAVAVGIVQGQPRRGEMLAVVRRAAERELLGAGERALSEAVTALLLRRVVRPKAHVDIGGGGEEVADGGSFAAFGDAPRGDGSPSRAPAEVLDGEVETGRPRIVETGRVRHHVP